VVDCSLRCNFQLPPLVLTRVVTHQCLDEKSTTWFSSGQLMPPFSGQLIHQKSSSLLAKDPDSIPRCRYQLCGLFVLYMYQIFPICIRLSSYYQFLSLQFGETGKGARCKLWMTSSLFLCSAHPQQLLLTKHLLLLYLTLANSKMN
jgi:hypothetical protein